MKYGFVFGAVVVAVLMVSSATAINVVQTKYPKKSVEVKNNEEKDEIYIDPNLHLTKRHLPILKRSIQQMKDDQYKEVVQRIIELIESKGTIDSEDVRQIIDDIDARVTGIHFSVFIDGFGTGASGTFPFFVIKLILPLIWLPTLIVFWKLVEFNGNYWAQVRVNFVAYDELSHSGGIGIGFFGLVGIGMAGDFPGDFWFEFTVIGWSLLVFVY